MTAALPVERNGVLAAARRNPVLALGLLLTLVPTLLATAQQSWSQESGVHGPLVLATAVWLVWRNWDEIVAAARPGNLWIAVPLIVLMSAAYVFVHLMPEMHAAREALVESASQPLRHEGMAVYFVGLVGFLMKKFDYEPAPLVLAYILGPLFEDNLRRSLNIYGGDFSIFFRRPISLLFVSFGVLVLLFPAFKKILGGKNR